MALCDPCEPKPLPVGQASASEVGPSAWLIARDPPLYGSRSSRVRHLQHRPARRGRCQPCAVQEIGNGPRHRTHARSQGREFCYRLTLKKVRFFGSHVAFQLARSSYKCVAAIDTGVAKLLGGTLMPHTQVQGQNSYRWVIVAAGGILGCVAIGAMFSLPVFFCPSLASASGWK